MIETELKRLEGIELSSQGGTSNGLPAAPFQSLCAILQALPVARSLKDELQSPITIDASARDAMRTEVSWNPSSLNGFRFARAMRPKDSEERLEFFWLDVRKALSHWGLSDATQAMGIQGAFREMHDNILQHSGAPASGMCGFLTNHERMEFGVADSGRGLIGAFRDAGHLDLDFDESVLLEDIVTKGRSRLTELGRGTGFDTLLRALRRVDATIRVRSDHVALRLEPMGGGQYELHVQQKPKLAGFVVCASLRRGGQG
ncbi:MAG: hypothetical protein KF686_17115 [Ramlibacter sp.]|nr:hypothetical protein [Ramlibacter sp.]